MGKTTIRESRFGFSAVLLLMLNSGVLSAPVTETFEDAGFSNHNDLSPPNVTVGDFEYLVQSSNSLKTVTSPAALYPGFDPTRQTTSFTIRHTAGAEFNFLGFNASNQFEMSEQVSVSGYRDGSLVASNVLVSVPWPEEFIDFSTQPGFENVDEVRLENTDLYFFLESWQRDAPVILRELTVTLVGSGTVESSPAGINCGVDCAAVFVDGSNVSLTATPDPSWTLGSWVWSGDCSGSKNICNLVLDADKAMQADFYCDLITIASPLLPIDSLERPWQCFDLEAIDGFQIIAGGEVTFIAEHSIELGVGFQVGTGGIFRAVIAP